MGIHEEAGENEYRQDVSEKSWQDIDEMQAKSIKAYEKAD
jgi:hypothetical protein